MFRRSKKTPRSPERGKEGKEGELMEMLKRWRVDVEEMVTEMRELKGIREEFRQIKRKR